MQIEQIARFSNLIGGSLALVSVLLPWFVVINQSNYLISSIPLFGLVLPLIVLGGISSLDTRYGGLITIIGLTNYQSFAPHPMPSFYRADYSFGLGYWIAWIGGLIALLGLSDRTGIRGEFPRIIKWALPPVGSLMAIAAGFVLYFSARDSSSIEVAAAWSITGILLALVGMTRGSVLMDHHPQLGN